MEDRSMQYGLSDSVETQATLHEEDNKQSNQNDLEEVNELLGVYYSISDQKSRENFVDAIKNIASSFKN